MKPDWKAQEKHQSKLKRFTEVYARQLLNNDINVQTLINIYDRTEKQPEIKLKRLLRSQTVQTMITEKLIELTEKHGITAKESLEYRKQVLQMAIDKGDLTNLNKALDSFDIKLDLQPIKQQQITTTQTDYIKLIDKNKGSIEAKQVKQIESHDNKD